MQQWQQLTDQQKKLAVVLIVVIVVALALIIWQLMPKGQQSQQVQQMPSEEPAPMIGGATGGPTQFSTSPTPAASFSGAPPEALPGATGGMSPPGPAGPAPETPAPAPSGKLETPPQPGRQDPFADLPASGKVSPFTPIVLLPTPEPESVARTLPGSIGTETFSTQDTVTSIPALQGRSVNLRSYFVKPEPTVERRELIGWRLAGTIMTEGSVGAIIQTPDGRSRSVRLGDRITYGGLDLTVSRVEEQQVMLKDSAGNEYVLTRRPAIRTVPTYGGTFVPGGFGPGIFGPGGFGPGGIGPGGFGTGGY